MHLVGAWYGLSLDRASRNQRWLLALAQSESLMRLPATAAAAMAANVWILTQTQQHRLALVISLTTGGLLNDATQHASSC